MLTAFFVMLREGFEAALIVAILYAYLRKTGRSELVPVLWAGVGAAFALAIAGGVVIQLTVESLDGAARLRWFAGISLFAVGVLTWMNFWMRGHARAIRGKLHHSIDRALPTGSSVRRPITVAPLLPCLHEG